MDTLYGFGKMSWKRAILQLDGRPADDTGGIKHLGQDLRKHWGFYLVSSVFTAAVCTMAVNLLAG